MKVKEILGSVVAALALACSSLGAQAAQFDFTGNITYHNDVVQIEFSLANDTDNVRVWTDSYLSGLNFDPISAVWVQDSTEWALVSQNDDNTLISFGQTRYDSGLTFERLAAGHYRFSVATYPNFARGQLLSEGFNLDDETPVALADWAQPPSFATNRGSFYSLHLTGVDSAFQVLSTPPVSAVPEPETYALMLAGLALAGAVARRRKGKQA